MKQKLVVKINDPSASDGAVTGGKGSSLARLVKVIDQENVPYAIMATTEFARQLLNRGDILTLAERLDKKLDEGDEKAAEEIADKLRETIENMKVPKKLSDAILEGVTLMRACVKRHRVAVRSSGITEDLPTAAFAGQFETYTNKPLDSTVIQWILKCIASSFGWRVVDYRWDLRKKKILDISEVDLIKKGIISVIIQVMVDSEKAGVAFSIDPDTGNRNVGAIQAVYGFGAMIVEGKENASNTAFSKKPKLKILGTTPPIKPQKHMQVYDPKTGENKTVRVRNKDPRVLTEDEAMQVAVFTAKIEEAYGKPMDVEFAVEDGKVSIVQARPETVQSQKPNQLVFFKLEPVPKEKPMLTGIAVGTKIASGPVVKAKDHKEARKEVEACNKKGIKPMLVTSMTTPDWEVVMNLEKVSGILCERGNRTSHAAIVSRERGIPCAVSVSGALGLNDGDEITLDCSSGDARIYKAILPFKVDEIDVENIPETITEVLVNIASPNESLKVSQLPAKGSSLVRIEFIVAGTELHPVFALKADKLGHDRWAHNIKRKFRGIVSLSREYVKRLKTGIATIAAAFYPRKIIVRFSDFKTNEYSSLPGAVHWDIICDCGESISLSRLRKCPVCGSTNIKCKKVELEFPENNPMLGFRGASRYISDLFAEAFELELKAMIQAHELELTNVIPMVPFVRTIGEAKKVTPPIKDAFQKAGLKVPRIIFMAEVPSICLIPKKFAEYCDGFSIGSNDLTQLILAIDRDSEVLAWEFDESDEAVKVAIEQLCEGAHTMPTKRSVGICGQAPSDLGRDFIEFLVAHLDSIGVNPDKVVETTLVVKEIEDEFRKLIKENNNDPTKIAEALKMTQTNAKYLIQKLALNGN